MMKMLARTANHVRQPTPTSLNTACCSHAVVRLSRNYLPLSHPSPVHHHHQQQQQWQRVDHYRLSANLFFIFFTDLYSYFCSPSR